MLFRSDLLAADFEKHVSGLKSPRAKASEIEHAIKAHISVRIDEDPAYFKKLSERLREILAAHHDKWDKLVEQLMLFRDSIETERTQEACDLGLSDTEFAFRNIIKEAAAECGLVNHDYSIDDEIIELTKRLVKMLDEASSIVDFFKKVDEIRAVKRKIKRGLMETSFGDNNGLRKKIIDQFLELAKVKFGDHRN